MKGETARTRRARRMRRRLRKLGAGRPRLSAFRSLRHLYAQVVDDSQGRTLAAASTLAGDAGDAAGQQAAHAVGLVIAQRALEKGVSEVIFDRGPYLYHGRVRALAEGAREGGLKF